MLAFRDVLAPFFRRRKTHSSGPFPKTESIQDRRALLLQPINILSFELSFENAFTEAKAELQAQQISFLRPISCCAPALGVLG